MEDMKCTMEITSNIQTIIDNIMWYIKLCYDPNIFGAYLTEEQFTKLLLSDIKKEDIRM